MSFTMRAKMNLTTVTKGIGYEVLAFNAVSKAGGYPEDGSDEDNTYAKFSPSASLTIQIANPALLDKFQAGEKYYVDFTPVPAPAVE